MKRELDDFEAKWIKAAGNAFTMIRLVTGYGKQTGRLLDPDMTRAVSEVADMLHNIGDIGAGNSWWKDHHTPERLELLNNHITGLELRYYDSLKGSPRLLDRLVSSITGKEAKEQDRYAHTRVDMFQLGWFGQGSAFWRWVKSDEALPYIEVIAAMRAPIGAEKPATDPAAEAVLSDPAKMDELAAWIEETYRDPLSSTVEQSSIDRR